MNRGTRNGDLPARLTADRARRGGGKARRIAALAAALLLALGVGVSARPQPASAANGLFPILDCVTYDSANNFVTAYWGYSNVNGVPITPDFSDNYFDPPPLYRGQPLDFQPGTYHKVFSATFSAGANNEGYLAWTLYGTTVVAKNDPNIYCEGADTVPPNTAIISGPTGTASNASATFELFASESGANFECKLDDGDFAACDSPKELTGLSDGTHTFQTRATDAAGNTDPSPATRTWTVDTTAPGAPTITGPANGAYDRDGSFNVRGAAEPGSTVRLYEGATRVGTSETDPTTGAWSVAVVDVPEGSHAYKARATDALGNVSGDSAEVTVIVDETAPSVTGVSPTGKKVSPAANITATFSETMDPSTLVPSTVDLTKKGASRPIPAQVTVSPDGKKVILNANRDLRRGATYTARITTGARDEAGNALASSKVWTFTVRR
ncbi:MAG TPA: Ig-like domain-containing protein [Rubrobacteraceae bacterium]|nr:Ig-like domain-containing protein [Rubrobacteraceae bacterium]